MQGAEELYGKTVLVTGGTGGIGKAAARALGARGARVFVVGRDEARGLAAEREILAAGGREVSFLRADFGSLAEVERLAAELARRTERLDALVHSAGILHFERETTADGFEAMFGTHYLARWLLTRRLLPLLERADAGRIVIVGARVPAGAALDFDDLQSARDYRIYRVVPRTQLANHLFAQELAGRLAGTPVTVNVIHPGLVDTDVARKAPPWMRSLAGVARFFAGVSPRQAAANAVELIASDEGRPPNGVLFPDPRSFDRREPIARDAAAARRLWSVTEQLLEDRGFAVLERPPGTPRPLRTRARTAAA